MHTMDVNLQEKSYDWIRSAISSSTNPFHIEGCRRLIELFLQKYDDRVQEAELIVLLLDKENEVYYF